MIQDYDKPMGVVTYKTSDDMPERLKRALPDVEELKKMLWLGIGFRFNGKYDSKGEHIMEYHFWEM